MRMVPLCTLTLLRPAARLLVVIVRCPSGVLELIRHQDLSSLFPRELHDIGIMFLPLIERARSARSEKEFVQIVDIRHVS